MFSLIRDSVTTYNDANIEVIEHLCRRGYKAFLRKEISNTGPYDPNLGDPLLIRLMTQPLPQVDGLDQEVFERWMAMFIEAIYGQDHFEYLMCPDTGSVCDTKC